MTSITFKNQYSSYNNPVNKVAKTSDVLPTSAAAATTSTAENQAPPNFIAKPEDKSFLENAQEALIYQRLGVDKETIAELKAAIEALAEELGEEGVDVDAIKEQIAELQKMLEQEFEKGTERMAMQPTHEKGKLVTALA